MHWLKFVAVQQRHRRVIRIESLIWNLSLKKMIKRYRKKWASNWQRLKLTKFHAFKSIEMEFLLTNFCPSIRCCCLSIRLSPIHIFDDPFRGENIRKKTCSKHSFRAICQLSFSLYVHQFFKIFLRAKPSPLKSCFLNWLLWAVLFSSSF